MIHLILVFAVICSVGCSAQKGAEFVCIADVDKNSRCKVIPCSDVAAVCRTGKYRILKNYATGYAYVYSTDPPTDMAKCIESGRDGR